MSIYSKNINTIKLLEELGRSGVDFKQSISEFIDNAIDAGASDIKIDIQGDWSIGPQKDLNRKTALITITDNGFGVANLDEIFNPAKSSIFDPTQNYKTAARNLNKIGQHGMGSCFAAMSIIDPITDQRPSICNVALYTKTKDDKLARHVKGIYFGEDTFSQTNETSIENTGTKIILGKGLKECVPKCRSDYYNIVNYLGCKYQNKLLGNNCDPVSITLQLVSTEGDTITNSNGEKLKWNVNPVTAKYAKKLCSRKEINGEYIKALLDFGIAPNENEINNNSS